MSLPGPRKRRGRILYSLLALLFLVAVVPLLGTSWYLVSRARGDLELDQKAMLLDKARSLSQQIAIYAESVESRIKVIARTLEVDTGRFGPIGSSLFLGARFYRVLGDRTISFGDRQSYPELETPGFAPLPPAEAIASWEVEVDPWLYRAQVGFRLQWLGIQK